MTKTSSLFVGLAFDSGGVTGGALTSAFLTPLTLGTAQAVALSAGSEAQSVLTNGFGIIAFISVTPLIAVQSLGLLYNRKLKQAQELNEKIEQEKYEELSFYAAQLEEEESSSMELSSQDTLKETEYEMEPIVDLEEGASG